MATFVYNAAKRELLDGTLDPSADSLALMLVMSNTTADTSYDALTISAITTLDENDGANYTGGTGGREALASVAMLSNDTGVNGKAKIDAADTVFDAPGSATRNTVAAVLYKQIGGSAPDGDDAQNIPIAYFDLGSFSTGSSDVTIQWSASDGFLNVS